MWRFAPALQFRTPVKSSYVMLIYIALYTIDCFKPSSIVEFNKIKLSVTVSLSVRIRTTA